MYILTSIVSFVSTRFEGSSTIERLWDIVQQNILVVIVMTAFLVAFLLVEHLFRPIIFQQVFNCGLQTLTEVLKGMQGSYRGLKILNLHLTLPLD